MQLHKTNGGKWRSKFKNILCVILHTTLWLHIKFHNYTYRNAWEMVKNDIFKWLPSLILDLNSVSSQVCAKISDIYTENTPNHKFTVLSKFKLTSMMYHCRDILYSQSYGWLDVPSLTSMSDHSAFDDFDKIVAHSKVGMSQTQWCSLSRHRNHLHIKHT